MSDPEAPQHPDAVVLVASMVLVPLVAVIVGMPFQGAMVRLRAHYAPKSISLDGEETRTNSELKGIFGTIQRTMALEGWWGIYKGVYITLISMVCLIVPSAAFITWVEGDGSMPHAPNSPSSSWNITAHNHPKYRSNPSWIWIVYIVVTALIELPFAVLINRAIVTPYKLPFSLGGSLRILLSRRERKRPYLLYCTPGLAVSTALSIVLPMITGFVMGDLGLAPRDGAVRAVLFISLQVLSTVWLVPIHVVMAKVSVQPNLLPAAGEGEQALLLTENAEEVEEDSAGAVRTSNSDEDVVNVRPALPRYSSFVNTLRTVAAEEGWQALYRGWIWTALGLLIGAAGTIPTYKPPQVPQ